jgi:pimeloyl-ACP methyl ester carboxylesterase
MVPRASNLQHGAFPLHPVAMPYSAPSLTLLATEPVRAAVEYARMRLMTRDTLPRGDDHPVVIFPGLATDNNFTAPLARHCEALGYTAYDWGRGYNTGPDGDVRTWLEVLARDVEGMVRDRTEKISLIGWSLGGIYAREIARLLPRRIRQVITIGTPLATTDATNVAWLYRLLTRHDHGVDRRLSARLRRSPPVPTSAIYSRRDGIVAWQACRQPTAPRTENIEVDSSHLGLPWHPDVLAIVADRLAQKKGVWRPVRVKPVVASSRWQMPTAR